MPLSNTNFNSELYSNLDDQYNSNIEQFKAFDGNKVLLNSIMFGSPNNTLEQTVILQ